MMEEIYKWISENPGTFGTTLLSIIGILLSVYGLCNEKRNWLKFIKYISKLVEAKKEFKRKVTRYNSYLKCIDTMHDECQKDYQEFVSRTDKFLVDCDGNYNNGASKAVVEFFGVTLKMTDDKFKNLGTIESKINDLKASEEVIKILKEVKELYDELSSISNKMHRYILFVCDRRSEPLSRTDINEICEKIKMRRTEINEICEKINIKIEELREQMRKEIKSL